MLLVPFYLCNLEHSARSQIATGCSHSELEQTDTALRRCAWQSSTPFSSSNIFSRGRFFGQAVEVDLQNGHLNTPCWYRMSERHFSQTQLPQL
ncbi:unnamed protein product [Sphagnum balticum]